MNFVLHTLGWALLGLVVTGAPLGTLPLFVALSTILAAASVAATAEG